MNTKISVDVQIIPPLHHFASARFLSCPLFPLYFFLIAHLLEVQTCWRLVTVHSLLRCPFPVVHVRWSTLKQRLYVLSFDAVTWDYFKQVTLGWELEHYWLEETEVTRFFALVTQWRGLVAAYSNIPNIRRRIWKMTAQLPPATVPS
jgi:hypothetical protein